MFIDAETFGPQSAEEFAISRELDVSRELVWKAWTEPERLMQWWGPKGFRVLVARVDLQPGGTFLYGMASPSGEEMWGKFVYREVVAPERLTYLLSFSDPEAGVVRHPGHLSWPLEMLTTVTFEDRNGKTLLTLRAVPYNATAEERQTFIEGHASMNGGFAATFDALAAYLAEAKLEAIA